MTLIHAMKGSRPARSAHLQVPTAMIGGLPIAVTDRLEAAKLMVDLALARRGAGEPPVIFTSANGQVLSLCEVDANVRNLFLAADLIHADGMPLVFASRLLSNAPLPERVATTDLIYEVAEIAEGRGATFYFLGATSEVIERAAAYMRSLYPRLQIVGCRDGYFGRDQEAATVDEINRKNPDILWLGLGVPLEQRFAIRNRHRMRRVGLIKTSGGLFDFLSGLRSRAPDWMQAAGLEWAYRVYQEPRRLASRYMITNPHALLVLMRRTEQSARGRETAGAGPERERA
jgi:N-acetylglucosaminyldiphosphoundecaprenol N-acetyl-beta-D-mannosaminyltransferase